MRVHARAQRARAQWANCAPPHTHPPRARVFRQGDELFGDGSDDDDNEEEEVEDEEEGHHGAGGLRLPPGFEVAGMHSTYGLIVRLPNGQFVPLSVLVRHFGGDGSDGSDDGNGDDGAEDDLGADDDAASGGDHDMGNDNTERGRSGE